jgi:hypothetical protein
MTEKKKKQIAIMKLEIKKKFMQMKIDECQKMAEMKKEIIENINKVEEMIKQGKKVSHFFPINFKK